MPFSLWSLPRFNLTDRQTFNSIVKDAAQAKRTKHEGFLRGVSLFAGMSEYERSQMADAVKEETFTSIDLQKIIVFLFLLVSLIYLFLEKNKTLIFQFTTILIFSLLDI